jgi:hypothetical protein
LERPPTQSGGPAGCAGRGSIEIPAKEKNRPWKAAGQRPQRLHRLVRPRAALARRDADGVEVGPALPADADPEDRAPAGDVVERGELLRDHARVAQRQQDDSGAERDLPRHRAERRERDDDVEDRVPVRDVVARPDRVEAELLGSHCDLVKDPRIRGTADELAAALDAERRHRERRQARS